MALTLNSVKDIKTFKIFNNQNVHQPLLGPNNNNNYYYFYFN